MNSNNSQLNRGLPASTDAERSILGAILLSQDHLYETLETLEVTDFSLENFQVESTCQPSAELHT
jgi:hypothetical protein